MYDELVKRVRQVAEEVGDDYDVDPYIAEQRSFVIEEAADALGRVPKWIPVTERLPEHDKNVLICYEWTGRSGTVYKEVGIASIEELERDPTEMFRLLCWMPLPEPPKEET